MDRWSSKEIFKHKCSHSLIVNTKFSSEQGNITSISHLNQGNTLISNTPPSKDNYFNKANLTEDKTFEKMEKLHRCDYFINTCAGTVWKTRQKPHGFDVAKKSIDTPFLPPCLVVGCIHGAILGWCLKPNPSRSKARGREYATSIPPKKHKTTIKPVNFPRIFWMRYFY